MGLDIVKKPPTVERASRMGSGSIGGECRRKGAPAGPAVFKGALRRRLLDFGACWRYVDF